MLGVLALSLALGLAVGYLRGGRLRRLAYPRIRWGPVLIAAVVLRFLLSPEPWQTALGLAQWGDQLYALCDGLVILFLAVNFRVPGMPIVAAGQASNLLVKVLNGWKMPVDPVAAEKMGYLAEAQALRERGIWLHSQFVDAQTRLPFLGDVVYIGSPYPWPRLFSPGDLLLLLGIVVCVQGLMVLKESVQLTDSPRERRVSGA